MSGASAAEIAARLDRLPASRAVWTPVVLISLGGVFDFAYATAPPALILLGIAFTLAANVMSYAYHGYQAELYPTRIRSRAVGFVYSWSRLAAAFAGLIIGSLLARGGVAAVAAFIGGAMLVGMASLALLGPATNGIALEQLNESALE